ncbi:kanadaptin-like isoform X1 [Hibiscus syriacus]|uniref:kanadaptin-like isoform X1 n=1 Tax=Hibiscus syriacus TaxID=106335 RepID=UPI001924F18B|nr:kanadaptin-like isoform X1 [Hibiscus syriacus]
MTITMGPPPPRNPNPSTEPETEAQDVSETNTAKTSMGPPPPPPPINPNLQNPQDEEKQAYSNVEPNSIERPLNSNQSSVPYTIPQWSGPPCHHFFLEVLKDGCIVDQFEVYEKGAYMFGRVDLCDFVLEHPTISRFHAVLQFRSSGEAHLYDLGSTHGTSVNKNQVTKRTYVDLHVGDVIRFGHSTRLYIFQGPSELMPPEKDLKVIREAKIREEMLDREASLRRARAEASLSDGISWGMGEDAIEEAEDDADEVTWQTYKGQLTEKQEKTRDKIIKRTEKIAHMKKEIDAIRAKDIAQGGLTQGQQTQIARNEQRMTQILEELESLEETLNDSIRESIGARAGKISRGKRKGGPEDEEEDLESDDDDFYDRTKKKPTVQKVGETQSIETADSLLDKRDAITKEIEGKKELLLSEKNKMASETGLETEAGDALDAYMSGLSSQLELDRTEQLGKELSALQTELDRISYLLKISDPMGEAAKKRDTKAQVPAPEKSKPPAAVVQKQTPKEPKKISTSTEPENSPMQKEAVADVCTESTKKPEENLVSDTSEGEKVIHTIAKPQWLGAVENKEIKESNQVIEVDTNEVDEFVDYKDRKKALGIVDNSQVKEPGIETASSGLIIRKQKQVKKPDVDDKALDQSTASATGAEEIAQNAVALLLRHTRGYHADDEELYETPDLLARNQSKNEKKPKRVLGPEKPSFLDSNPDETWVPPEGQSGDGRTKLNDRYGY